MEGEKNTASCETEAQKGDPSVAQSEAPDQSSRLEDRDAGTTYMAWATDPKNDNEIQETRKFLNETVVNKAQFITTSQSPDHDMFIWGSLTLDDAALKKVKAYPKLKDVIVEPEIEDDIAISRGEEEAKPAWHTYNTQAKRAPSDWTKQNGALKNLALINVEKDKNQNDYKAFVYEKKAGDGTFIYVMDGGVAYNVEYAKGKREFPKGKAFPLQTDGSKALNQKPDEDDSVESHATQVASIALGQRFGVAKKATLISVKAIKTPNDRLNALRLIHADLTVSNPLRPYQPDPKKSVVLMPFNFGTGPKVAAAAKLYIGSLLRLGVPVVVTSGNKRTESDQVSSIPAVQYAADFPIIVVGGTNINGNRYTTSQGGSKVAVHAPGVNIKSSKKDGSETTDTGTSFAAPAVAGLISTYMAYSTIPWDDSKTKKDRITEIRRYLQSDASSVARGSDPDIRTIWNGVSKSDYDNVLSADISGTKPSKGMSLSIAMVTSIHVGGGSATTDNQWKFYTTKVGKAVSSCGETEGQSITAESNDKPAGGSNADPENPPWPAGIFKLNIEGEACVYRCDGTNPGRLFCPKKEIACREDSMKSKAEGMLKCGLYQFFHPVVYCDF